MKRLFKVLMIALLVCGMFPTTAMAENNTTIVSDEININEMDYGVEYVIYDENEIKITVKMEPAISTRAVGDSGWSGGTIPPGSSTLHVNCRDGANSMSYKLDVIGISDGPRIVSAHSLFIQVYAWTINSSDLSIIKERATNSSPATATATTALT